MTESSHVAIRLKDVSYSIGEVSILKNITGAFYAKHITTLVGPSGSGKTSLLKLCNGLASPSSGEIWINGQAIESFPPVELRRKIGFALQNAPMMRGTVFHNLSLPLLLQGKELMKQDALHYLDIVGLDQKFLMYEARDLSGGQKQKVSIARTLVNRPDILLLDEITSALDQTSTYDMEHLIQKIKTDYGVTVIWITHNLEQAKKLGDYTWIMMEGEVVETGTSDILHQPQTAAAKSFIRGGHR